MNPAKAKATITARDIVATRGDPGTDLIGVFEDGDQGVLEMGG